MSFDLLAPCYRWLELCYAGNQLHRCRTAFLAQLPEVKDILILGEGHGRSLAECRRRFPEARITCVDSSAGMLAQARRHLNQHGLGGGGIEFICADAVEWKPAGSRYDLIVTHFFLDCLELAQIAQVAQVAAGCAVPGAHWLVADFQIAPAGWRHWRSRVVVCLTYLFFRFTTGLNTRTLTNPDEFLRQAGFTLHKTEDSAGGLLYSAWWKRQ